MNVDFRGCENAFVDWHALFQGVVSAEPTEMTAAIGNVHWDSPVLSFSELDEPVALGASAKVPDLDGPDAVQTEMLADACAKIGAGLAEGVSQSVMFDIYALMKLLVECGQEMRDAARNVRFAENQQVQASIQAQADQQRQAAIVGLAVGISVCAMQVICQGGNMVYQGKAANRQMEAHKASGIEEATVELKAAKAGDGEAAAAGVAAAEAKVARAIEAMRTDIGYVKGVAQETRARMFGDMIGAIFGTAQTAVRSGVEMMQAEATREGARQQQAQEMLDQAKDLFSQCLSLIDAVIQLMRAVLQAEVQSMRDAIQA